MAISSSTTVHRRRRPSPGLHPRAGQDGNAAERGSSLGLFLLLGFSALNLWSGGVLSRRGEGTPLPLECPRKLVVSGPYSYVRNPMAIAGLGQGLAVVILLGSWTGLAYVAMGVLVWQYAARPSEERDLHTRFGSSYEQYQQEVRCWWPRVRAFHADDPARL